MSASSASWPDSAAQLYIMTRQKPLPDAEELAREHARAAMVYLCARAEGLPVEIVEMILGDLLPGSVVGADGLVKFLLHDSLHVSAEMLHAALAAGHENFAVAAARRLVASPDHVEHAAARGLPAALAAIIDATPCSPDALYAFAADAAGRYLGVELAASLSPSVSSSVSPVPPRFAGARAVVDRACARAEPPPNAVFALIATGASASVPRWRWPRWRASTAAAIYAASAPEALAAEAVESFAEIVNEARLSTAALFRISRLKLAGRTCPAKAARATAMIQAIPARFRDSAHQVLKTCDAIVAYFDYTLSDPGSNIDCASISSPDCDYGSKFDLKIVQEMRTEFLYFLLELVDAFQIADPKKMLEVGKRSEHLFKNLGLLEHLAMPDCCKIGTPLQKLHLVYEFAKGKTMNTYPPAQLPWFCMMGNAGPEWLRVLRIMTVEENATTRMIRDIVEKGVSSACKYTGGASAPCAQCFECLELLDTSMIYLWMAKFPELHAHYWHSKPRMPHRMHYGFFEDHLDPGVLYDLVRNAQDPFVVPTGAVARLPPVQRDKIIAHTDTLLETSTIIGDPRYDPYWEWIRTQKDTHEVRLVSYFGGMTAACVRVYANDFSSDEQTRYAKRWQGVVSSSFIHKLRE